MSSRFEKHYTREEARAILPQLREWLEKLEELKAKHDKDQRRLTSLRNDGQDLGGEAVNNSVRVMGEIQSLLREFEKREIIIKDLDRGLVDFPALIGGKEVFLCWEKDEEDVEYWHDLDSGFAGREPL